MSIRIDRDGARMRVTTSDTVRYTHDYTGTLVVQSDTDPFSFSDQRQCIWINMESEDPDQPGVFVKLHKEDVIALATYLHERITA